MTRLIADWIADMENSAAIWNDELKQLTGIDYIGIGAMVSGCSEESIYDATKCKKAAVIPVTSGQGTILSFSESVAAIVRAMGFDVFVTEGSDVNGLYEAHIKGADVVFMADDDRYIALNIRDGSIGDNNIATAAGYVEVLDQLAEGLAGKRIAVLGYGIIGQLMAEFLTEKGATVAVFDKNYLKKQEVLRDGHQWIKDVKELKMYKYIADGTSEGGWLSDDMMAEEVLIVAPGIPLSLTEEAQKKLKGRYVHDLLEIGTAAMMALAVERKGRVL